MLGMHRSARQKVIAAAAAAVLLGGAAFAAVSATGQGDGHPRARGLHALRLHPRDIEAAAAYLGVPSEQLARELAGKSLAQIAEASPGKSAQGLTDAIVASRRARLAKASAVLPKRVQAEVSRTGGPAGTGASSRGPRTLAQFTSPGHLGSVAAGYLGLTSAQLRGRLRSGESLAQIAEAVPGRSKDGLVAALVAAKQKRIATAVASGHVTRHSGERREQRLRRRMDALSERKFAGARKP